MRTEKRMISFSLIIIVLVGMMAGLCPSASADSSIWVAVGSNRQILLGAPLTTGKLQTGTWTSNNSSVARIVSQSASECIIEGVSAGPALITCHYSYWIAGTIIKSIWSCGVTVGSSGNGSGGSGSSYVTMNCDQSSLTLDLAKPQAGRTLGFTTKGSGQSEICLSIDVRNGWPQCVSFKYDLLSENGSPVHVYGTYESNHKENINTSWTLYPKKLGCETITFQLVHQKNGRYYNTTYQTVDIDVMVICSHSFGERVTIQEATEYQNRIVEYTCQYCGAKKQEEIEKICGDNLMWQLDSVGTLTISGTGPMYDYSGSNGGGPWGTAVKKVVINEGVTSVGKYAFYKCGNLTSVTIPDGVTSIGYCAFYGCSGLTSVTIPDSVTSIGDFAFYGCSGLTNMTIPDGVTSIGHCAFYGCSGLTSVTIPDSVTSIGDSAFAGCSGLTSVTIPNSVTSIGDSAFYNCNKLTKIYGYTGSAAETYAKAKGKEFVALPAMPALRLPAGLTAIEADAFQGINAVSVMIPKTVTSIDGNPFAGSGVRYVYGFPGSAAETFANHYGFIFVSINDAWLASH